MRTASLSTAVCLMSLLLGASPAQAVTGKDIANWSTYCSGGLTCRLSYRDIEKQDQFDIIELRRSGGLSSEVELRLRRPPRSSQNLDPDGAFRVLVDGKHVLDLPVRQFTVDGGDRLILRDQPSVLIVIEAMKAGNVLQLNYDGAAGKYAWEMKLDGFRGSLFFIDDVQGRRGRNDALFAVGQKVPEGRGSKDIVSLDDIPASIRADFTVEGGSCTEGFRPEDIGRYSGFDISLDGVRLLLVPCSSAGAHNQPYALYRGFFDGVLTRISFPDVEEGRPSISEVGYNVDFDPTTRIMTSFVKDNGLATCGLWHKWRLTDDGNLVLLQRRGWYECDDGNRGPEDFPLEWPVDGQP